MILRSIWCKRGVHKKESLRRTGMVKWMSTPDSLYSVVLCRVYGFLAGCKGMRRKNAENKRLMIGEGVCGGGINSIRVIRIFLSFFLSSLPSSMTNWKRHKKRRCSSSIEGGAFVKGVLDEARRKEECTLEIFLIIPFSFRASIFRVLENGDFVLYRVR